MRTANLVLGLAVTATGLFALVEASGLDMFGEHGVPGPGFLPSLVAGALVVLGLVLTGTSLTRRRAPASGIEASNLPRVARVWGGFLVSIPVMALIGFVPAMALLVAYLVFGVERVGGIRTVLAAVLIPALVYALFALLLGVELPPSSLFDRS